MHFDHWSRPKHKPNTYGAIRRYLEHLWKPDSYRVLSSLYSFTPFCIEYISFCSFVLLQLNKMCWTCCRHFHTQIPGKQIIPPRIETLNYWSNGGTRVLSMRRRSAIALVSCWPKVDKWQFTISTLSDSALGTVRCWLTDKGWNSRHSKRRWRTLTAC